MSAPSWRLSQVLCICCGLPLRSRPAGCRGVSLICHGRPPGDLAVLMDPLCLRPCAAPGVSDRDAPVAVPSSPGQAPGKDLFPSVVMTGPPGLAGGKLGIWSQG